MPKKRKAKPQNNSVKNIAIKTAIGSAISLILFFSLAAVSAFILWKNDADTASFKYILFAIGAVSGFLGGFTAVRPIRKNGIVLGAVSSLLPCIVAIGISALIAKGFLSATGWIFIAVNVLFSAIGGIIAVNKRK